MKKVIGAEEAIAPVMMLEYFIRNQADSIPPYDPPKVMIGLSLYWGFMVFLYSTRK